MSDGWSHCESCGRRYRANRYNQDRQKYCTYPKCVAARKRKRQREWYANRRASDPEFLKRQNTRCAEANRRRRSRGTTAVDAAMETEVTPHAVLGLISQLTDTADPELLRAHLREYDVRGRRVALPAISGPGPP